MILTKLNPKASVLFKDYKSVRIYLDQVSMCTQNVGISMLCNPIKKIV